MKTQFDNYIMSSALMWLDNRMLSKGEAFKNFSSKFYPIPNLYSNLYSYGLPFKQIVCDSSIAGADLLSGVYVNNVFTSDGQGNLSGINPSEGQIYFGQSVESNISGRYAVKDFNTYLTSDPEESILFETQYKIRPKTSQTPTGLAPNSITYPAIFIKNNGGFNKPYAFGGLDQTNVEIRLLVLSDSIFNLDAVCSILRDSSKSYIPIIRSSPFNSYGFLRSGHYNYNSLAAQSDLNEAAFISEVMVSKIANTENKLNPGTFPAVIDIILENIRYPRA